MDEGRVSAPTTWLLEGHKAGDNAQLQALAEALGWEFETRHFTYRSTELITNRLLGPTLAGIVPESRRTLGPPWPQLILTAGRRNEPVARWIRSRAGGRLATKIVHLGRPWAALDEFDLIITTPQYHLPDRPNILHIEAPLHRLASAALASAATNLRAELVGMYPPYLVVLLGGDAGVYRFDSENARLLGHHVSALAAEMRGCVLAVSSRRTPARSLRAFGAIVTAPLKVFEWTATAPSPYLGLLGLADRIVVTSDSVSMLTESIATGKPVLVFDLAKGTASKRPGFPSDGSVEPADTLESLREIRLRQLVNSVAAALGPRRMLRDLRRIAEAQVDAGRATWLGQPSSYERRAAPMGDLMRAAERVRGLFA